MDRLQLPPTAGIVGGAGAAVVVVLPYLLPDATATAVAGYYDYGIAGPWMVLVCGLLAVVVYASGRQGRTEHDTAAGAGLALGLGALLFGLLWVVAVPFEAARPVTPNWWFEYHRFAVVAAGVLMSIVGLWYAYELELI